MAFLTVYLALTLKSGVALTVPKLIPIDGQKHSQYYNLALARGTLLGHGHNAARLRHADTVKTQSGLSPYHNASLAHRMLRSYGINKSRLVSRY